MLKIAICDDDNYYLTFEEGLIQEYVNHENINCEIALFTSGFELLNALNDNAKFDIIFLDIEMSMLNGIETAKRIRKLNSNVYLVFVTAFITYAIEGYKMQAFRYIVKEHESFEGTLKECMDAILQENNYARKTVSFKFREGTLELLPEEIVYVESDGHKVNFKILKGSKEIVYTRYDKLDAIEKKLDGYGFCRIHKSYLVNLRYIKKVEGHHVELKNGVFLNIAKSKYMDVNNAVINFWGEL
ncbi:MAG: response regulator transcription factor [Lachnospiraceae bacterium]|nr:response regulator transcription factor [Lachnospiraceae bacterium]